MKLNVFTYSHRCELAYWSSNDTHNRTSIKLVHTSLFYLVKSICVKVWFRNTDYCFTTRCSLIFRSSFLIMCCKIQSACLKRWRFLLIFQSLRTPRTMKLNQRRIIFYHSTAVHISLYRIYWFINVFDCTKTDGSVPLH